MTLGDRVMVVWKGLAYSDKIGTVSEVFRGTLNGFDLGALVVVRFADGYDVALPPGWLRRLAEPPSR